ncbi:HNH endonuclease [Schumannella luteola]|nr:HNH endonuclease [Schumannella luteola]
MRLPCWLCGQPIDYDLQWPDPGSFSVDHVVPHSRSPELREDPGNLRSSHLLCNQKRGDRGDGPPALGLLSERW